MMTSQSPHGAAMRTLRRLVLCLGLGLLPPIARGATVAPPLMDVTGQCNAVSRHDATAMSECVVAESEARAEILQTWDKLSDARAQKCIKVARKSRKLPYTAMAKCLFADSVSTGAPAMRPAKDK